MTSIVDDVEHIASQMRRNEHRNPNLDLFFEQFHKAVEEMMVKAHEYMMQEPTCFGGILGANIYDEPAPELDDFDIFCGWGYSI